MPTGTGPPDSDRVIRCRRSSAVRPCGIQPGRFPRLPRKPGSPAGRFHRASGLGSATARSLPGLRSSRSDLCHGISRAFLAADCTFAAFSSPQWVDAITPRDGRRFRPVGNGLRIVVQVQTSHNRSSSPRCDRCFSTESADAARYGATGAPIAAFSGGELRNTWIPAVRPAKQVRGPQLAGHGTPTEIEPD